MIIFFSCQTKSTADFPILAKPMVWGKEARRRLSGHGFSTEASLLICGSKAAGVPRGSDPLVAGPGREGEAVSGASVGRGKAELFPLQETDVEK
jgi:hypothetical protein